MPKHSLKESKWLEPMSPLSWVHAPKHCKQRHFRNIIYVYFFGVKYFIYVQNSTFII